MTAIDVTPAGNQLYQVDIRDRDGESRHEVGVPDHLLERMDTDGVAMQDVVASAIEFVIEREGRQELDHDIDLTAIADRYDEFVEQVPARARQRGTDDRPPTGFHAEDRDEPSGDERLTAEVRQDQQQGNASRQERRY